MGASRSSKPLKSRLLRWGGRASVPMRGSRFAGVVSIRKVIVPGASGGAWPQLAKRPTRTAINKKCGRNSARLARRRIADLTENGPALRTRSGRQIRRAAVKSFIGENCEGERFLAILRDVKRGGRFDFDFVECGSELRHD